MRKKSIIKNKKKLFLMIGLLLTILMTGCSVKNDNMYDSNQNNIKNNKTYDIEMAESSNEGNVNGVLTGDNIAIVYDSDDRNINIGIDKSPYYINLEDNNIILSDNIIGKIVGSKLTIQKPGTYVISGTLNDGQIVVDSVEDGIVHLIFEEVSITSKNSAPLYIKNSTKTVLTLKENTSNYLIDSDIYEYDNVAEQAPDAALYSKGNLTINGSGNLNITANFKDGIASEKELKIIGANLTVKAKDTGIRAKDYLAIESGNISVSAGNDGLKSINNDEITLGYIVIDGGTIHIKANREGIQAKTAIKVNNGKVNVTSRGEGMYAVSNIYIYNGELTITSGKRGVIADKEIYMLGGTIAIDSIGNAIHSNQFVHIYGGSMNLQSKENSIRAEKSLIINGGS